MPRHSSCITNLSAIALVWASLTSCVPKQIPEEALKLDTIRYHHRTVSTRHFDSADKASLIQSSTSALQDLGFIIKDSDADLGLVYAEKERSAFDILQFLTVLGYTAVMVSLHVAAAGSGQSAGGVPITEPYDTRQQYFASVVVSEIGTKSSEVRVTFYRKVWNNFSLERVERISNATTYRDFFDKLSKASFLEAHNI